MMEFLRKMFVINKRAISITYSNIDHDYNGDYQGVRLNISGIVPADSSLFASNPLAYTHTGISSNDSYLNYGLNLTAVNVGSYNIKVSGLTSNFDNSNYYLSDTSKN